MDNQNNMKQTSDIEDIVYMKQIKDDLAQLQKTCKKETDTVLKNQIAQDGAFWELTQKYNALENNNETLKQNMRAVQFEYESVSGQYQEELRLRPEVLNKVRASHEIHTVLQTYMEQYINALSTIKEDQKNLAKAYDECSDIVKEMRREHKETRDKHKAAIAALNEKNEMMAKYSDEMAERYAAEKREMSNTITVLQLKLENSEIKIKEAEDVITTLENCIQTGNVQLQKKDEIILDQDNKVGVILEQNQLLNNTLNEKTKENEYLKKTLENKEDYCKLICDEKNALQEKINEMEATAVEYCTTIQQLNTENEKLKEYNNDKFKTEINLRDETIQDLNKKLEAKVLELEDFLKKFREHECKLGEITEARNAALADIKGKSVTINRLAEDHKLATEMLSRLELQMSRVNQELDNEKAQTKKYELIIKEKENEIASHVKMFTETCTEKEALKSHIWELEFKLLESSRSRRSTPRASMPKTLLVQSPQRDNYLSPPPLNQEHLSPSEESNADENVVDQKEVERRWNIMARGGTITHLPFRGLIKRKTRKVSLPTQPEP